MPPALTETLSSDLARAISLRISPETSRLASTTSLPMVGSSAWTGSRCAMTGGFPSVQLTTRRTLSSRVAAAAVAPSQHGPCGSPGRPDGPAQGHRFGGGRRGVGGSAELEGSIPSRRSRHHGQARLAVPGPGPSVTAGGGRDLRTVLNALDPGREPALGPAQSPEDAWTYPPWCGGSRSASPPPCCCSTSSIIGRRPHEPSQQGGQRRARLSTSGWRSLFGIGVWVVSGHQYGTEFFAGWLTEYSLSVDNLFIFLIIMAKFAVPKELQQSALLVGIVLALIMRGIFIASVPRRSTTSAGSSTSSACSWSTPPSSSPRRARRTRTRTTSSRRTG